MNLSLAASLVLLFHVAVVPASQVTIPNPTAVCVANCEGVGGRIVDYQAQRMRQLADRYQQVWRRLRAEGVSGIDNLTVPESLSEPSLTPVVDRLYNSASFDLAVLRSDREVDSQDLKDYQRMLESERSSRVAAEETVRLAPPRLARAEANRDRLRKEAVAEEQALRQLEQAANRAVTSEEAAANSLLHWLGPFLNQESRAALAKAVETRRQPSFEPRESIARAARAAAPPPQPAYPRQIPFTMPPPPPAGTLDTKLAAVEDVAAQIMNLRPIVEEQRARVTTARDAWQREQASAKGILDRAAMAKSQIEKVEAEVTQLEYRVNDAVENQTNAGRNLAWFAAYTYIWSDLKDRLVVPAVKEYVATTPLARKFVPSDDSLRELYEKLRDGSPSEALGLPKTVQNIEKLVRTERIVLETFTDTRGYIDRAVTVLATGTPEQARELSDDVFLFLDSRSLEIAEQATETLPESVKAVAKRALRF